MLVGPLAVGGLEWMGFAGDRWTDLLLQAVLRTKTSQAAVHAWVVSL